MSAFVLYFALVMAAGCQAASPATQPKVPEKSAQPTLSAAEVSSLRAKAETGDASAQFLLGQAYEYGNGVPQNDESAAKWYRKSADQENAAAQNRLGIMYRLGLGVNPDKTEAVRWYHKSAKLGNPQAMFNLGVSYYNGDGVPSDPTTAHAWFLLAQQAGNPAADEAVRRSAEEGGRTGTPDAMQEVAAMYEKGEELRQSYPDAAKWYRKAADKSPLAAVKLAAMLVEGRGVPRDYAQAMDLCKKASKSDYAPAQYCVGLLHDQGWGIEKNPKEAAKWYVLASHGGNFQAMMKLGEMYRRGEGVTMDRTEAYYYFFQAAVSGSLEGKTQGQAIWKEMSKDEIKHLEKRLRSARLEPQKVFAIMQSPENPHSAQKLNRP